MFTWCLLHFCSVWQVVKHVLHKYTTPQSRLSKLSWQLSLKCLATQCHLVATNLLFMLIVQDASSQFRRAVQISGVPNKAGTDAEPTLLTAGWLPSVVWWLGFWGRRGGGAGWLSPSLTLACPPSLTLAFPPSYYEDDPFIIESLFYDPIATRL